VKLKPFKKKRLYILIFEWLYPTEIMLKLALCSKNFYIVSWDCELLRTLILTSIGLEKYRKIR
jgi:hypothetical protein